MKAILLFLLVAAAAGSDPAREVTLTREMIADAAIRNRRPPRQRPDLRRDPSPPTHLLTTNR
jgi:hypothetical protein